MLEICLDNETKDELTKIKRNSSIDDFRLFFYSGIGVYILTYFVAQEA